MIMKTKRKYLFPILLLTLMFSCVEPIDFTTENFEEILFVDATITNEMKKQEIRIGRTYQFEASEPVWESNATVKIFAGETQLLFEEIGEGLYTSSEEFAAQPNIDYKLEITTSDGNVYSSTSQQLTQETQIDELYAERITNDDGVNGMSIYVDSFDPSGNSKYYRYEYEETYKVIAPAFINEDLILIDPDFPACEVGISPIPRAEDKRLCYATDYSQKLTIFSTNNLIEDRVSRFPVRFISSMNYIITHRYSILVRQYVHSREGYAFYETLKEFSENGDIFTQNQPGFINGNLILESDSSQKVVGFFDVVSVSSKRIFFSYSDFYPGEPYPPYAVSCGRSAPARFSPTGNSCGPLISAIALNTLVYFGPNEGEIPDGDAYLMVLRECGDCTALGTPIEPDFWIE
tara:strand:- start:1569 stop:2783 length:1215 start_codon:yes stop_codon:yes gene_type:complete